MQANKSKDDGYMKSRNINTGGRIGRCRRQYDTKPIRKGHKEYSVSNLRASVLNTQTSVICFNLE